MRYCVIDNWNQNKVIRSFNIKNECKDWIMSGLFACEGAERDHYVHMLCQLEDGKRFLEYWD